MIRTGEGREVKRNKKQERKGAKPQKGGLEAGNVTGKDLLGSGLVQQTLIFVLGISSEQALCAVPMAPGEEEHKSEAPLY